MPLKNTLYHLSDTLFELIDKLNDDDLTGPDLEREIKRAGAINQTSTNLISIAGLALRATVEMANIEADGVQTPRMLETPKAKELLTIEAKNGNGRG